MIRKIVFVVPSLRAGGAERVMSFLAENLPSEQFKVTLISIGHKKDQVYQIDEDKIDLLFLEKSKVSKAFFVLLKEIYRINPEVVMSSIGHLNILISLIALFKRKTAFVAREANIDKVRSKFSSKKKGIRKINLKKHTYRFLATIVCQSKDMYDSFTEIYPQYRNKTIIINNPITDSFTKKENTPNSKLFQFITVGSLHPRKGHGRILDVLGKFNRPYRYTILGDGNEKTAIFKKAESLGITNKLNHIPYTNEVAKFLVESHFYLQGSYVEGFPNAVIESCAVGTPVLAFDAPGGINEIVKEGINGCISKSEDDFLQNLEKYSTSYSFSPEKVSKSVTDKYGKDVIIAKYVSLFNRLIDSKQ